MFEVDSEARRTKIYRSFCGQTSSTIALPCAILAAMIALVLV